MRSHSQCVYDIGSVQRGLTVAPVQDADHECVKNIVVKGKDMLKKRRAKTTLEDAIWEGRLNRVRARLRDGADPNAMFGSPSTFGDPEPPIQLAARLGHVEIVKVLLEAGADPNARYSERTALISAIEDGQHQTACLVIRAGADVNDCNEKGVPPMILAASKGLLDVVRALIEAGADVNAQADLYEVDHSKYMGSIGKREKVPVGEFFRRIQDATLDMREVTALIIASRKGHVEVVKELIRSGSDLSTKDGEGKTAFDWARLGNHSKIEQLFQRAENTIPKPSSAGKRGKNAPTVHPKSLPAPHLPTVGSSQPIDYQNAIAKLIIICGSKPQRVLETGFGFELASINSISVEELQQVFQEKECFIFAWGRFLAALPTRDKFRAIAAVQTRAENYDLDTDDIIRWLQELEKEQPFMLTAIEQDSIAGKFTTEIKDPIRLAKRMSEFCPDIVDHGSDAIRQLAERLKQKQTFSFWWD